MRKLKDFVQTELCDDCIFLILCKGINLPHCDGEDYVKRLLLEEKKHV